MAHHYSLRAGVLILVASLVILTFALLIGRQVETSVITEYTYTENRIFPMLIRDVRSTTFLILAGTRCFPAPSLDPEWRAIRQQYQPGYMTQFQASDSQPENVLIRLRCP
jgi:hypothetical protein